MTRAHREDGPPAGVVGKSASSADVVAANGQHAEGCRCGECRTRRGEWSVPKRARARQADALALITAMDPLPEPGVLRDETLRHLRAIATDATADTRARVAASKLLLDATEEDPLSTVVRLLGGSRRDALTWLRGAVARLEAELAADSPRTEGKLMGEGG